MTKVEFVTKVKEKYPEYKDIDDIELADRVINKYPEYKEVITEPEITEAKLEPPSKRTFIQELTRPFKAQPIKAAEAFNRAMSSFSQNLDSISRYVGEKTGTKPSGLFKQIAKTYQENADYWDKKAKKIGVNVVDELIGSAVGGAVPGITEFALGVPYSAVVGAAGAKEQGTSETIGAVTEGLKRAMLGKAFKMISPLKQPLKAGATGILFGTQAIGEGGTPEEIAKSVGTGLLYGAGRGGSVGIRDIIGGFRKLPFEKLPPPVKSELESTGIKSEEFNRLEPPEKEMMLKQTEVSKEILGTTIPEQKVIGKTQQIREFARRQSILKAKDISGFEPDEIKTNAKNFYFNEWHNKENPSPVFNNEIVRATDKGFLHITRPDLSEKNVIRRLRLLPRAKEILETSTEVYKEKSAAEGINRYGLIGMFDDGKIVKVVVEEIKKEGKEFYSVYDVAEIKKEQIPSGNLSVRKSLIPEEPLTPSYFNKNIPQKKLVVKDLPAAQLMKLQIEERKLLEKQKVPTETAKELAETSEVKTIKDIVQKYSKETLENVEEKMINLKMKAFGKVEKIGIKEGKAITKEQIMSKINAQREMTKSVQDEIISYMKLVLPHKDMRGQFVNQVRNAKTVANARDLFETIDNVANKFARKDIIAQVKDIADNLDRIDVTQQKLAMDIINQIEWDKHTKGYLENAGKIIDYMDRSGTFMEEMPGRIQKKVGVLEKRRIEEIETYELIQIKEKLKQLYEEGKTKLEVKSEIQRLQKQKAIEGIKQTAKNLDTPQPITSKEIGGKLKLNEKSINQIRQIEKRIQAGDWQLTFIDRFFDMMDGLKNYQGKVYKTFKEPIDKSFSSYLKMKNSVLEPFWKLHKELKLEKENYERIGVYAMKVQENGINKLLDAGYTGEQISRIILNPSEMRMYNFMRNTFDSFWDPLNKLLIDVENRELGKVKNYFPMQTDYNNPNVGILEFIESNYRKSSSMPGAVIERLPEASQVVRINAMDIFLGHIDNVSYAINMDRILRKLGRVARDEEFRSTVGNKATKYTLDWVDLLSRRGTPRDAKDIPLLDTLRRNMGVAVLGLKVGTFLKQPLALFNGAAEIGGYAFSGAKDVILNKNIRNFIYNASAEIRNRAGDDPGYIELSKHKWLETFQKFGLSFMQRADAITAGGVWFGAYKLKLKQSGKTFDINNVDGDAVIYADRVVRSTQSTALYKDLPFILTQKYRTMGKAVFTFQSFFLNEWNYIKHDLLRKNIVTELHPLAASQQLLWLTVGTLAEYGISQGIYSVLNSKKTPDDTSITNSIVFQALQKIPLLGNVIGTIQYGTNPIPVVELSEKIVDGLRGIFNGNERQRLKGTIKFAEAVGMATGIPGSSQLSQIARASLPPPKNKRGIRKIKLVKPIRIKPVKPKL